MRCLWIASGFAFALLALSMVFRPPAPTDEPVQTEARPLRSLSDEDVTQILALRAVLGSPPDCLDGEESQAAFEQQLREMAGLNQAAAAAEPAGKPANADNPRDRLIDNDRAAQAQ